MHLFILALFLSSPVNAARCGRDAAARTEAAEQLIREAYAADPVDKAAVLERARILLERTVEDEPGCKAAVKLKAHADGLYDDMQALSSAAAQEAAVLRADDSVAWFEANGVDDPETLQALRFQLAALQQLLPGDERVVDLARRAGALGVEQ